MLLEHVGLGLGQEEVSESTGPGALILGSRSCGGSLQGLQDLACDRSLTVWVWELKPDCVARTVTKAPLCSWNL